MIKVDLLYSNYLNSPDGASRFVKTMMEQKALFAKFGIDLRVITPDMFSYKEFNDSSVAQPSLLKKLVRALSKYSVLVTRARIHRAYELPALRVLSYYDSLPNKGQVVAFQESFSAYVFLKHFNRCQQKVILSLHSNGELWSTLAQGQPRINSILLKGYRNTFMRTLFDGCYKIGFVADLPRKHFCELYNYSEKKTFYVYNGISSHIYIERPTPKTLDLVCVGSLTKNKNQIGVINAISSLPSKYQEKITFTIVGDGTERPLLEAKAKGLLSKVFFTGNSKEVDKYLISANCYILFSKGEGLPISIIEAMRLGLPILGSKVGGIPEQIIDGESGFVLNLDEKELTEKLRFLIDNLNMLQHWGRISYDYFIRKFTIEAMVRKYSDIYQNSIVEQ